MISVFYALLFYHVDHGNRRNKVCLINGNHQPLGIGSTESFYIIVFMVSCSVEQGKVLSIGILNVTKNSPANKKENMLEIACACNFSLELRALLALNLLQENCILFCYNLLILLLFVCCSYTQSWSNYNWLSDYKYI